MIIRRRDAARLAYRQQKIQRRLLNRYIEVEQSDAKERISFLQCDSGFSWRFRDLLIALHDLTPRFANMDLRQPITFLACTFSKLNYSPPELSSWEGDIAIFSSTLLSSSTLDTSLLYSIELQLHTRGASCVLQSKSCLYKFQLRALSSPQR
jgi:hypothetical protein